MGAKLFRCIGVIPNLSRAKRCCFVPYPEFFSQKYPGYLTDNSSIILSLYTFAIIDAAAIDRDLLSPLIIGYILYLDHIPFSILVLQMSAPVAITSYLLAKKYNADDKAVAGIVIASTSLSILYFPIILYFQLS